MSFYSILLYFIFIFVLFCFIFNFRRYCDYNSQSQYIITARFVTNPKTTASASAYTITTVVGTMSTQVIAMSSTANWIFVAVMLLSIAGFLLFSYIYSLFEQLDWYDVVAFSMNQVVIIFLS